LVVVLCFLLGKVTVMLSNNAEEAESSRVQLVG